MRAFIAVIAAIVPLFCITSAFAENTISGSTIPAALDAGNPHNNCPVQYYPTLAVRLNHEGATTVAVHIDDKGNAPAADIVQSSGWPELDDAAKQCIVENWHFTPAIQNGKPIASVKNYRVVWKLNGSNNVPKLKEAIEDSCRSVFASDAHWAKYKSAVLQFRISATGDIKNPFVAITSGDTLFDAKAVQCMSMLKYTPDEMDDIATEISWSAAINWSPHTGVAFRDRYGAGPFCPDTSFPAQLWKGDPANSTIISFHIVQGGASSMAAIEQSSGNSDLDGAALKCLQDHRFLSTMYLDKATDVGETMTVNWRNGQTYVLYGIER